MPATVSIPVPMIDATDAAVETFKFLGDKNRLRILQILAQRESCVCELVDQIDMTQPLISYHLRRLREAGLVRTRRKAQWVYYSIEPKAWRALVTPLLTNYLVAELPPAAAYGASDSCDGPILGVRQGSRPVDDSIWLED